MERAARGPSDLAVSADVVIVGGGPVGGTLALALREAVLTSSRSTRAQPARRCAAIRSLALSHGGRLIFERLGVWPRSPHAGAVTPIAAIDISQARRLRHARRSRADEHGVPALGYVISIARCNPRSTPRSRARASRSLLRRASHARWTAAPTSRDVEFDAPAARAACAARGRRRWQRARRWTA